jgi:hypothetical protein
LNRQDAGDAKEKVRRIFLLEKLLGALALALPWRHGGKNLGHGSG